MRTQIISILHVLLVIRSQTDTDIRYSFFLRHQDFSSGKCYRKFVIIVIIIIKWRQKSH